VYTYLIYYDLVRSKRVYCQNCSLAVVFCQVSIVVCVCTWR